jgi:hypothetical protein
MQFHKGAQKSQSGIEVLFKKYLIFAFIIMQRFRIYWGVVLFAVTGM